MLLPSPRQRERPENRPRLECFEEDHRINETALGTFIGQTSDQALRWSLTLLKNVLVLEKDARVKV